MPDVLRRVALAAMLVLACAHPVPNGAAAPAGDCCLEAVRAVGEGPADGGR